MNHHREIRAPFNPSCWRTIASRVRRAAICVAAVATFTIGNLAAPAEAGTYTHWSCHGPDGTTLPIDGWQGYLGSTLSPLVSTTSGDLINRCTEPPTNPGQGLFGLWSRLDKIRRAGAFVAWGYTTPNGLHLRRYRVHRYLYHYGGFSATVGNFNYSADAAIWNSTPNPSNIVESTDLDKPNTWKGGHSLGDPRSIYDSGELPANINRIFVGARCIGNDAGRCDVSNPAGDGGFVGSYVAAAEVGNLAAIIEDTAAPVVSSVSGSLMSNATHTGTERVAYNAADSGVGVYRAVADVKIRGEGEWRAMATSNADVNGGECSDAGFDANDPYEFVRQLPCKTTVNGAILDFDTRQLPPGTHQLRVVVEDAAGNRTDVISEKPFVIKYNGRELAPINGAGASNKALIRLHGAAKRTVAYGKGIALRGTLVDENGKPIRGATMGLERRSLVPKTGLVGPAWIPVGTARTAVNGTFSVRIPASSSRALRISYRSNPAQDGLTNAVEVELVTRANATVKLRKRRLRNGQTAILIGRVAGPIPKGGVLVSLEAFVRSQGWVPVATTKRVVRTKTNGSFQLAYRFKRTTRKSTYRFRVLVNEDSAFEYGQGVSRSVKVIVRP